jgi:hypothetical protein
MTPRFCTLWPVELDVAGELDRVGIAEDAQRVAVLVLD